MNGALFRRGLASLAGLMLALNALVARADLISFDDIDPLGGTVADQGYTGFDWDNRWALGSAALPGFGGVAHSGVGFLYNDGLTSNLEIRHTDPFDFLGLYVAAPDLRSRAWWVSITAYDRDNRKIGSTGYQTIGTSPQWLGAFFTDVSRLVIDPYGGLFAIDSLQFRQKLATLSEAGSLALLGIGLCGLWLARRRQLNA